MAIKGVGEKGKERDEMESYQGTGREGKLGKEVERVKGMIIDK